MQIPRPYYATHFDKVTQVLKSVLVWCRNEQIAKDFSAKYLGADNADDLDLFVKADVETQKRAEENKSRVLFV